MYCKSILSKNLISNTSLSRNGSSSKLFNTHERFEFHSKSTSKIFLKSNYQSSSSIVINNNNNVKNNSNSNFFGKNNRLFSMAKKINEEPMKTETKILADGAISGNRSFIAKAITLVESTRRDHHIESLKMLSYLREITMKKISEEDTFRIGISGPPGVGKSTFIEALGMLLTSKQKRVAVLAIDPSSAKSGGSVLGDKTRMEELSKQPNAYVRPSPTRGTLGGVARGTGDAIQICEAAGYDNILIETVGVGQSETAVADMSDLFLLLMPPAGGDELQGIKKGVMEFADLVVVNKADGDLAPIAKKAATEYHNALKMFRHRSELWNPSVLTCSALNSTGIEKIWEDIEKFRDIMIKSGSLVRERRKQRKLWMWKLIEEELVRRFSESEKLVNVIPDIEKQVVEGLLSPGAGVDLLIDAFERE